MDKINQLLDGSPIIREAYDTSTKNFEKDREKVYS